MEAVISWEGNRRRWEKSSQNRHPTGTFVARRVRSRFHARPLVGTIFATLLVLLFPRHAFGDELRVLVRTVTDDDRLIFERIVGHTSDLPAKLHELHEGALEDDLALRLDRASNLAATGAQVIVWFEHVPDNVRVVVAIPDKDRVLLRDVGRAGATHELTPAAKSAVLEETALVVSTALYAIGADVLVGVSREALLGTKTEDPVSPTEPIRPSREPTTDAPSPSASTKKSSPKRPKPAQEWRASIGVGCQLAIDGQSLGGSRAGAVSGNVEWRDYSLELALSVGLPSQIHDEYSSLSLSRHATTTTVGRVFLRTRKWTLRVGVGGGGVLFSRAIERNDSRLAPSASRSVLSPLATADITLRYFATNSIGLMLVAGVDGIAHPPSFTYEVQGAPVPSRTLWFFEPRSGLYAFYAFP
jgi:hypothetical protein